MAEAFVRVVEGGALPWTSHQAHLREAQPPAKRWPLPPAGPDRAWEKGGNA